MRALTLHQPWASLIAEGLKEYETRSWAPNYADKGEVIAIHAGVTAAKRDEIPELYDLLNDDLPVGAILAVGRLVSVDRTEQLHDVLSEQERMCGDFSDGRYAWRFAEVIQLENVHGHPRPIPCRGAQGLWTVPPDVEAMVRLYLP